MRTSSQEDLDRTGDFDQKGHLGARKILRSLVDVVFPPRCLACTRPLETSENFLCEPCDATIDLLAKHRACPTCASDVAEHALSNDCCRHCRSGPHLVSGTVRGAPYRSTVGDLLRGYKYDGREELEPLMVELLASAIDQAPWRDQIEAIVAVPTHWRRRLSRSIHAAETLALAVASRLQLPTVSALRRVRSGPHQVGLSFAKRAENVRGAFAKAPGVTLHAPTILLVDDVRTSGATMNECARVLRKAGAERVYAAVVARVGFEEKSDVKNLSI
jgi:ComF family protein